MKQRLILLLTGFTAWTLFFIIGRGLFMAYHSHLTNELSFGELALVFMHGSRMDFSMAGYFSLIPGLLLAFGFWLQPKTIWKVWFWYHVVILFITSFIIVLDFELYKHWGFRLDATPLMYMGKEAAGSGDFWKSIFLIFYWLLIFGASLFSFHKYFRKRILSLSPTSWQTLPVLLLTTALFVVPIRGSFGVAPMNTGFVYFHETKIFANHAAVNVVWNFLYAVQKMNRLRYADNYFEKDKTETYFKKLVPTAESTAKVVKPGKPNVVIIMLESFTSSLIEPLAGLPGITPNFNSLVKEGILFDHFYCSGDRTDKGIVALLNGYPSQPVTTIIKEAKKTKDLSYLNKVFKQLGYRTEFTYGYNINYANFNSYLIHAEFDHVTHSKDFPQELNTSKWGVHDHYVFDKFFEETQKADTPFFKIMMTQSSHEPFEVPMETVIKGEDEIHRFLNSAYYTDKCLGEFIEKAKKTSWWANTLVVITADHGHPYPDNQGVSNPKKFKIPMLWLGGALTKTDTIVHSVASQTDIPNTILAQFDLDATPFKFGQNILSPSYNPFAIFVFNNGFGMVRQNRLFVYDNHSNSIIQNDGEIQPDDLNEGKAYIQTLYWDYNSR
jgi:phosphoglycerol transferase MdoB-like AlkP superfamily enzyme